MGVEIVGKVGGPRDPIEEGEGGAGVEGYGLEGGGNVGGGKGFGEAVEARVLGPVGEGEEV